MECIETSWACNPIRDGSDIWQPTQGITDLVSPHWQLDVEDTSHTFLLHKDREIVYDQLAFFNCIALTQLRLPVFIIKSFVGTPQVHIGRAGFPSKFEIVQIRELEWGL
jgi:hypothetical protein